MEYKLSLWDPICIGDRMFLFLNKNAMKKEKIPSEELIYENEFKELKNLKAEDVILQLYPKYLVIRNFKGRMIRQAIKLELVKCIWIKNNDYYGI